MKGFIHFLLIGFIAAGQAVWGQVNTRRVYSAGSRTGFPLSVGVCLDSSARVISHTERFPNLPGTGFVWVENGQAAQFELVSRDVIRGYTCVIKDGEGKVLYKEPVEKLPFHKNRYASVLGFVSAFIPETFSIRNRALRLVIYKETDPSEQMVVDLFNKPLDKLKPLYFSLETQRNTRFAVGVRSIHLNKEDESMTVYLEGSRFYYAYVLIIKEKKTGKVVFKERAWTSQGQTGEGNPVFIRVGRSNFRSSGEYEFIIQPELKGLSAREAANYATVSPVQIHIPGRYSVIDLVVWSSGIAAVCGLTGFLVFRGIRKRNRQLLYQRNLEKKIAEVRLNVMRTQLNPHFLFNALSTIQGLINGDDKDKANDYLGKFARLTRKVLENEVEHTIESEVRLLEDYLQMEQLRFGFNYRITVSDERILNREIPALLTQPLVENAIKHGVMNAGDAGRISVDFISEGADLLINIRDNGKGFRSDNVQEGRGIGLTRERIALLNENAGEEILSLSFQSGQNGTVTALNFKSWL
ncbi:MAG: histidine kinase [Leadbetterella sp.]|nr:histidine kinase [Leadbetterella sp.]